MRSTCRQSASDDINRGAVVNVYQYCRRWISSFILVMGAVAAAGPIGAPAGNQTCAFDISPQELGTALRAFAYTSHQQVVFEDSAVRGKRSPPLKGDYTAYEALDRLLEGSGLSVQAGQSGLF